MSGHSKWSTIHRQKEAKDAKRGAAFTKLANAITIAVREGGGVADPETNFRLRLAVDKARASNMPKENIQRAIDRGAGLGGGVQFEQVIYEGFGPGGAAIMVEAATDNRQRTISEVKNVFEKMGGNMGSAGSVGYMFKRRGFLTVETDLRDETAMQIIDLGADDVDIVDTGVDVYTDPQMLFEIKQKIESMGLKPTQAELVWDPVTLTDITGEAGDKLKNLLERLDALDDVQKVYTNADFK